MGIHKYINRSTKDFLKKSQKRMKDLKKKLHTLKKKEDELEEEKLAKYIEEAHNEVKIVLSVESVVKSTIAILLVLGFVQVLGVIKSVIILFFVALFLAATLNPAVDKLEEYRVPRPLGIIIVYILLIGIFVVMFGSLVPIIAEQLEALALSVRGMVTNLASGQVADSWITDQLQPFADQFWSNVDQRELTNTLQSTLKTVASKLTGFAGNALGVLFTVFNGILNTMLVLIITFFMVVNSKLTSNFFHSLFPSKYSNYISVKSRQMSSRIGEWVRGQVTLALVMGGISFIAFSIIGLNYALTLAMVSAIAEFIPYLGPLITFSSAALIAVNQDPLLLIWLLIAYAVLQFVEGNVLVPMIVGRSVGLNPIVVIFSLLSGATIGVQMGGSLGLGLVGMIVAVPVANIISIFVEEYTEKNKSK